MFARIFQYRIFVLTKVPIYDGAIVVRFDAEFCTVLVFVIHRTGGETNIPTVWYLTAEWQSCSTSCLVTYDSNIWAATHIFYKFVGCTENFSVSQYDNFLLPTDTT